MLAPNFRATENADGTVTVHDVPIFAECKKGGFDFDATWLEDAVKTHAAGQPMPMHVQHHGESVPVQPAGAWTNARLGEIVTKVGRRARAVLADLVFTNREAADRARRRELLWRSVEIPPAAAARKEAPRIRSLALLDRNAPHVDDLPVLVFSAEPGSGAGGSFEQIGKWERLEAGEPVLAFSATNESVRILMEPNAMPETPPNAKPKYRRKSDGSVVLLDGDVEVPVTFESDDAPKDKPEGGASKVEGLIQRIKEAKLTAEEWGGLKTALAELMMSLDGVEKPDPIVDGPGDPNVAMKDSGAVVALRAKVEAMELREKAREREAALARAVDEQYERVKDRGVTRDTVLQFAEQCSDPAAGAKLYADEVLRMVPVPRGATFAQVMDAAGNEPEIPAEVLKFQNDGPEAYARALKEYRLWREDRAAGGTMTFDRWFAAGSAPGFVRAS